MAEFFNISSSVNYDGILSNTTRDPDCPYPFIPTSSETVSSLAGKSFLVTVYSLASLAALLGNSAVIVVELYGSESAQNIRKYLINLAVADIIIGVFCVPLTYSNFMLGQWILPHWLCPFAQYVQLLNICVSSFILSLIGVERYLAILHPFSHFHRWLESHTNLVLTIVWALGASYSTIILKHPFVHQNDNFNSTTYSCSFTKGISELRQQVYISSNIVLTFLLPLVVLICAYLPIIKKLKNEQLPEIQQSRDASGSDNLQPQNTPQLRRSFPANYQSTKIIKMMFTIILLFIVCWLPIKVYKFLYVNNLSYCTETEYNIMNWIYLACHWISMASSFVNPIIYSFMSKSFWKDLERLSIAFQNNTEQSSIRTISVQV